MYLSKPTTRVVMLFAFAVTTWAQCYDFTDGREHLDGLVQDGLSLPPGGSCEIKMITNSLPPQY